MNLYTLSPNGVPCREFDVDRWVAWMQELGNVFVASTFIGKTRVSTVFLGFDMQSDMEKTPPRLFETIIFGGMAGGEARRCRTIEEARDGHMALMRQARAAEVASDE